MKTFAIIIFMVISIAFFAFSLLFYPLYVRVYLGEKQEKNRKIKVKKGVRRARYKHSFNEIRDKNEFRSNVEPKSTRGRSDFDEIFASLPRAAINSQADCEYFEYDKSPHSTSVHKNTLSQIQIDEVFNKKENPDINNNNKGMNNLERFRSKMQTNP